MRKIFSLGLIVISLVRGTFGQGNASSEKSTNEAGNAPATAASTNDSRNIRFQFDGIPYMDLVERFAQMAGKPLIAETNVAGTVTFNDSRPYTYGEALETVNTILAMKNVMLVETDRYLQLVPFKDLPQMPLKIFRGLDKTGDVRGGEVVTVVLELKNLDAGEIAKAATPMLSNAGSIAPLSRGRGLIITDRMENIRRVKQLIAEIDTNSPVERQMRTYTLLNSSGAVVSELINKTFGAATAPKKTIFNEHKKSYDVLPPDPEDYVTSVFDEASRTLLLFGPAERLQMAEDLIHRFEDKEGARGGEVKIIYPKVTKVEDLARMIRQAIPGVAGENESGASAATKARVIVDSAMKRLIITAPIAGQMDSIENLVNRVERGTSGGGSSGEARTEDVQITKVLRLQVADPATAFRVVTNAFVRTLPNGETVQALKANLDAQTKTIVVTGSPGDVQHAIGIIDQMEDISPASGPMETIFLDFVSAAEMKRVQPMLQQLYASQVADGTPLGVASAKFIPDSEAKRLIVTGTREHLKIIEKIADQLRSPAVASQPREFHAVVLKNIKVDAAQKTITDLVTERMSDELFRDIPKPLILPDPNNNRLLITANAAQFTEIQEIIKAVDIAPKRAEKELANVPLQTLSAGQILPSLTQLMRPLVEAHSDTASRPEVIADATGKSLIISASASDLEKIREMIRQLEGTKTDGGVRQFKSVKVFNHTPAEVVTLAEQLYKEQMKGQPDPAGGPASFVPEGKGSRVIVIGSETEVARAENIIRQIDPAMARADKDETRVIRLRNAQAQDLATLIEKSLNIEEQRVKLLVDQRSNSLVVSGSAEGVESAARMIEQLDTLPNSEPKEIRMIELKSSDTKTVLPVLNDLLGDVMRNMRGSNYVLQSKIVAEPNSNRLIVTGVADELQQISAIVQRLDAAPKETDGSRVFQLRSANAGEVAKIITETMVTYGPGNHPIRRVSVSADEKSNSIVVTGARNDLQDVATIIEKLDGGEKRSSKEVKVVELATDEPAKLVSTAQQVWTAQSQGRPGLNDVTLTLEPSGRRVVIVAPANLMPQVEEMLLALDQKPDGAARSLQTIELKQRAAGSILPALTRIYEEQQKGSKARPATIVPEASGRRLLVYGSEDQAAVVKSIVEKLESGAETSDRETRMFEVGQPEDVTRILPLVQQLYQEQMKNSPASDPADAQILPDERAGRIIVTGRPEHLTKISEIIAKLVPGKLAPKERETRVYNLNSTTADELVTMVRSVYQQELKKNPRIVEPSALILPDPLSNRLIVSGLVDELDIIDEVIKKLDQVSTQTGNTRTFQLKNAQADQVATLLSTTLVRWTPGSGRSFPRVTVGIDSNNNTLIVSGQPADLAAASTIIEKLDSNAEGSNKQLGIFQIRGGNTSDFAARLKQLYNEQVKSKPDYGPADALILADIPTDRLIITASEKQISLIEKLVTDLDKVAGDGARELRVFKLAHNPASEILPIVNQMFTRNMGNTDLSQRLVLTPGVDKNILVAEAPKPILDKVQKLIEEVDVSPVSGSGRGMKILNIGSVEELQRLSPILQQLYREQLRGNEVTDPADAQFIPDTATGRLIVTARTNQITQIEAILEQIRGATDVTANHETRIYNLNSSTATELAGTVNSLYQDQLKANPVLSLTKALILPDAIANRLIVSGSSNQLASIEQIITQLDQVSPQTAGTRVFKLKSADAGQVSAVISTALVQIDKNSARTIPRVSVGADTNSNSLVVSGDAKDLNAAAVIIEQLDNGTERKAREMRILSLKSGKAVELAAKVRALYLDQVKNEPGSGPADALILGDATSDRLIITANEPQLELIQKIVSQLDEIESGEDRQLAVRPLKKSSAMSIAAIIQQFFQRNIESKDPSQKLVVTTSPDDRSLILEGNEEVLAKVDELARTLEDRPEQDVEVRSYQLGETRASDLAPTLARLFVEKRPGDAQRPPKFEADAAANILLVAASPEQFQVIDKLIEEVKATASLSNEIRTFRLVNTDAEQLLPVLSSMLKAEDPSTPQWRRQFRTTTDPKAVTVGAAAAVNAIIVQGPPGTLQTAEQIIRSLDGNENAAKSVIQTVHLKKAMADVVADAVNKTLAARGPKSNIQRATVTPVMNSNSLLIDGPSESVQDVIKIIHELDEESAGGEIEIRVYKLEHGKARELSTLVNQMLQSVFRETVRFRRQGGGGGDGGGRRNNGVTVTPDERTNSLIVSASPDHFKTIEQLLVTLDQNAAKTDRSVRFVLLKNARSVSVAMRLNSMFENRPKDERPVIESDTFGNSVTIIGSKSDIAEAESVIAELDQVSREESIQVRMLVVENLPAEQMAKMLKSLYSQMSHSEIELVDRLKPLPPGTTNQPAASADTNKVVVTIAVDRTANALLMSGPSHELDAINNLVDELTFASLGNDSEFRQFPLKEADPVAVAKTLNELFKQEPIRVQAKQGEPQVVQPAARMNIVAEPRTRSIIVRGKATDFILLESLLQQLDQKGATAQLAFRLVKLDRNEPAKLLPLVNEMVKQITATRPGEPISVLPDQRTRSIFVAAREMILDEIEQQIKALDTPPAFAEAEVALISLKNTLAPQVATILQNMLKPAGTGESTPEARELQEQVRALKITNDDGHAVLLDLNKPVKIMADGTGAKSGNRLIVSSTPDNIAAVRAIVEMMDTVALVEGVTFRIVRLKNSDAQTVAQTLTQIFTQGKQLAMGPNGPAEPDSETGRALAGPLSIASDRRSNSLVLTGKPESIELAQRLLKDLDEEFKGYVTTVRLFRLNYASAIRLAPLLQSVFTEAAPVPGFEGLMSQVTRLQTLINTNNVDTNNISAEPRSRAALTIQAEGASNTLIVAARTDMMPLIEDVIKSMDIPAATGMESVRIYPLKNADANRLLRIITEIYAARGSQLRPEEKPGVTVDTRTNALIVSGNERIFAFIETIIKELDKELPFEYGEFRVIKLENADAGVLANYLQQILTTRAQQKAAASTQPASAMRAIVIGDPRLNSLIVGGDNESFELVQALAKQLDAPGLALSGQIRLVPLKFANAGTISSSLNTLFNQRYSASRSSDVQRNKPIIIPDPRMNALLVSAGVEDNKALDDLLSKLDQKLEDPALVLNVIPLKHNDSARVSTMIRTVFAGRLQAMTLPGSTPNPQDRVVVDDDTLSNALVVVANKENQEIIRDLVAKVDREPEVEGGLLQIITLKKADASRVASMLRNLVSQGLYRPGMSSSQGRGGRAREAMAIAVDTRSNTLIVSASPENLAILKEVINRIDSEDYSLEGDIKLYTLKHARASQLAQSLQQFFQAKRAGEAQGRETERSLPVTILPDDRTNTLLVTGGRDAFEAIDRILAQLDTEDVYDKMNFRVFSLKNSTAAKLQSTLTRLFMNRPARVPGRPVDPISIVADSWANALVVGAAVEDMAMVANLIQTLDNSQPENGMQVQVIPVLKGDATSISQTITSLYRETPGAPSSVKVDVDARLNALVVSAGEADMKRIVELVEKLDTAQVARVSEIKIFPLKFAQAQELARVLTEALTGRPVNPTPQSPQSAARQSMLQFITRTPEGEELVASALKESLLITADERRNALVISAPVDSMNLLSRLISSLDSEAPQMAKIRVFKLVNADARQMAEVLTSLFRLRQQPGVPSNQRAIQYTLVRDVETGDLAEGEPLTATIGSAEQYALTVTIDLRTNSLLLGGSDHYVGLAAHLIEELDSSPAQEHRTEVYRLKNSLATNVVAALSTFIEQERRRIVAVAEQSDTTTNAISAVAGNLQQQFEREIAIVAEPISNTLLLSASPRYFDRFKALIEDLDQPMSQVLIQVILAEVTLDKTSELGVEWTVQSRKGNTKITTGTDFGVADQFEKFGGFSSAITGSDVGFVLRALEADGRLEVLSRPQILTADNQKATIDIGQRIPLVTDSRVTERGDTINSYRYENVGVSLTVTPRISPDGFVKMEVEPMISQVTSSSLEISPGIFAPFIAQRKATTTVSVQNGQSVIIGGLISTTDDKRRSKVPILGNIPYLGFLFRSSKATEDRKELLIILTPQLLAGPASAQKMTEDQLQRSTIKDEIKRDKLQEQILEPILPMFPSSQKGVTNAPPKI